MASRAKVRRKSRPSRSTATRIKFMDEGLKYEMGKEGKQVSQRTPKGHLKAQSSVRSNVLKEKYQSSKLQGGGGDTGRNNVSRAKGGSPSTAMTKSGSKAMKPSMGGGRTEKVVKGSHEFVRNKQLTSTAKKAASKAVKGLTGLGVGLMAHSPEVGKGSELYSGNKSGGVDAGMGGIKRNQLQDSKQYDKVLPRGHYLGQSLVKKDKQKNLLTDIPKSAPKPKAKSEGSFGSAYSSARKKYMTGTKAQGASETFTHGGSKYSIKQKGESLTQLRSKRAEGFMKQAAKASAGSKALPHAKQATKKKQQRKTNKNDWVMDYFDF